MQNHSTPALFEFEALPIRVLTKPNGNLWFVAIDIAAALEYRDAANMVRNLDEDESDTHIVSIRSESGFTQNREVLIVNESGLYSAIMLSRKPAARRFKRWVTAEVLPSIRKTGSYSFAPTIPQQIALSCHRVTLLKELHRAHDNGIRAAIHEQVAQISHQLGLSVPDLSTIGVGTRIASEITSKLWDALEILERKGERYNHAPWLSGMIYLKLPHLGALFKKHGIDLLFDTEMRKAMKASKQPKFVLAGPKGSSIEGKTIRCWVFEGPLRPEPSIDVLLSR